MVFMVVGMWVFQDSWWWVGDLRFQGFEVLGGFGVWVFGGFLGLGNLRFCGFWGDLGFQGFEVSGFRGLKFGILTF